MQKKSKSFTRMKQLDHDIKFISKDIFQHFLANSTKSDAEIETYSYYEVGYDNSAILKSIDKKGYYLYAFRINQKDSQALIYVGKTHDNSQRLKRHLQWKNDNGEPYAESYKCQAKNIQELLNNRKATLTLCLYNNRELTMATLLALESSLIANGKGDFEKKNQQTGLKSWNKRNG